MRRTIAAIAVFALILAGTLVPQRTSAQSLVILAITAVSASIASGEEAVIVVAPRSPRLATSRAVSAAIAPIGRPNATLLLYNVDDPGCNAQIVETLPITAERVVWRVRLTPDFNLTVSGEEYDLDACFEGAPRVVIEAGAAADAGSAVEFGRRGAATLSGNGRVRGFAERPDEGGRCRRFLEMAEVHRGILVISRRQEATGATPPLPSS